MAADMLFGDELQWHSLSPNGTVAFFDSDSPRMLVLSRLELDHSIDSCCSNEATLACHDAYVFRSPLNISVDLALFNFGQNGQSSEQRAVRLLRQGGYDLHNPCLQLPLFHNHVYDQSTKGDENRCKCYT